MINEIIHAKPRKQYMTLIPSHFSACTEQKGRLEWLFLLTSYLQRLMTSHNILKEYSWNLTAKLSFLKSVLKGRSLIVPWEIFCPKPSALMAHFFFFHHIMKAKIKQSSNLTVQKTLDKKCKWMCSMIKEEKNFIKEESDYFNSSFPGILCKENISQLCKKSYFRKLLYYL